MFFFVRDSVYGVIYETPRIFPFCERITRNPFRCAKTFFAVPCELNDDVRVLFSGTFVSSEEGFRDTREGEDVTLECRFPPQTSRDTLTYYWAKKNKQTHDNVAIGDVPLDTNYKWVFSFNLKFPPLPTLGKYSNLADVSPVQTAYRTYEEISGLYCCIWNFLKLIHVRRFLKVLNLLLPAYLMNF